MEHDGLVLGIGWFSFIVSNSYHNIITTFLLSIVDHDKVGEQFLTELGFPAGKKRSHVNHGGSEN